MQQFLKPAPGPTRTRIIAAELLEELLLAAPDRAVAALNTGLAQGTPGAACSSARRWECGQKESWVRLCLAIRPPGWRGRRNLKAYGRRKLEGQTRCPSLASRALSLEDVRAIRSVLVATVPTAEHIDVLHMVIARQTSAADHGLLVAIHVADLSGLCHTVCLVAA
jgi:hypothetical protein